MEAINVAGESHYHKELQDNAFSTGNFVSLVPEPENEYDPNAIGVWDADRRLKVGHIPADDAERIGKKLANGDIERAIVMWESKKNRKRVGIRLLLLGKGASVVPAQV